MTEPDYVQAHKRSIRHRREITESRFCGCFYCLEVFPAASIVDWTDEDPGGIGQTALCPVCGIDSVIGSESGYPLTRDFLKEMKRYWF